MMWHPLDGNMIAAGERECQLVELDDGTYCEGCGEYVEESCDGEG
jgi:hypothetical protein